MYTTLYYIYYRYINTVCSGRHEITYPIFWALGGAVTGLVLRDLSHPVEEKVKEQTLNFQAKKIGLHLKILMFYARAQLAAG